MAGGGFNIEILGLKEVERIFDALPFKIQRSALRPALKAGAAVFQAAIQREAPVRTGALRDNFIVKAMRSKKWRTGYMVLPPFRAALGIPKETRTGSPRGYYPFAIHFGWHPGNRAGSRRVKKTAERDDKRLGRKKGDTFDAWERLAAEEYGTRRVPANPFMTRAFVSSEARVVQVVAEELTRRIEKLATIRDDGGNVVDFDISDTAASAAS